MAEESLGVGQLFVPVAYWVVCAALLASGWVAVTGDPLAGGSLAILFIPFINAHVSGVRHRWLAALAALAVGGLVGTVVGLALPDGSWGHVGGMIAGSLAAVAPYALVTQVGRPRPAPAGSAGPAGPG
jgi:Mn2+/Fe2+ NRAMP family transporter